MPVTSLMILKKATNGNMTTWNGMMSPLRNIKKMTVDVFVLVLTSTHAAIAEKTDMVVNDPMVMMTEENTLEEYRMLGRFHISLILTNNCDQWVGKPIGSVMISRDALAELMITMKNGNSVTINNKIVISVRLALTTFLFVSITFPPLSFCYSTLGPWIPRIIQGRI